LSQLLFLPYKHIDDTVMQVLASRSVYSTAKYTTFEEFAGTHQLFGGIRNR
jgi:hypothetical protein